MFVIGGWLPGLSVNRHTLAALLVGALLVFVAAGLPAQSKNFPVDELRPGMVGVGRTDRLPRDRHRSRNLDLAGRPGRGVAA